MDRGKASVLVVAASLPTALESSLLGAGLAPTSTVDSGSALTALDANLFDLLLVHLEPEVDWLPLLESLHDASPDTPLLVVGPEEQATMRRALAAGAVE